jgi:hypothetical protein
MKNHFGESLLSTNTQLSEFSPNYNSCNLRFLILPSWWWRSLGVWKVVSPTHMLFASNTNFPHGFACWSLLALLAPPSSNFCHHSCFKVFDELGFDTIWYVNGRPMALCPVRLINTDTSQRNNSVSLQFELTANLNFKLSAKILVLCNFWVNGSAANYR